MLNYIYEYIPFPFEIHRLKEMNLEPKKCKSESYNDMRWAQNTPALYITLKFNVYNIKTLNTRWACVQKSPL